MLPSDVYESNVIDFLVLIEEKRKGEGNPLISELSLPEMLRHVIYAKSGYDEMIWSKLLELLKNVWDKDEDGVRGQDVKMKLDKIHDEESRRFLEEHQLDRYELWFQLIWMTYRLRSDLWSKQDPGAPAFARRTGKEGDYWAADDILKVLETWPIGDGDFPSSLHRSALINLQVLRKRREHVFEANELLNKARMLYRNGRDSKTNSVYGMYAAVDIPAALVLAEAINSAYTKEYAKTINLAQIAWTEASKLSMENPMRLLFMAWASSTLTGVYSLCDLQGRIEECKLFYPEGIIDDSEHRDWPRWASNLKKEDLSPRVMLYTFKHANSKDKNDWMTLRGEAYYVFKLINDVNDRAKAWGEKGLDNSSDKWNYGDDIVTDNLIADALEKMCVFTQARVGSKPFPDSNDIVNGLRKWLNDGQHGLDHEIVGAIEKRIGKFEKRKDSKQLKMCGGNVCKANKEPMGDLLQIWKRGGVFEDEIPTKADGRRRAIKKILEPADTSDERRAIFKLFDGAGCLPVGTQHGHRNVDAWPIIGRDKENLELLKGKPNRTQRTALFNYVSLQIVRLAFHKPNNNGLDILDISRLEFRFLWLVHLMTWTGIGKPGDGLNADEKESLIYRDLPWKGKTNRLHSSPTNMIERIEKMGLLVDDYEDAFVKISQSDTYAARPLLLLMARMLNYRWYELNQFNRSNVDQEDYREWGKIAERTGGLLNKIMNEIKALHPINLNTNWKYSEWFKRSCGPLEKDAEDIDFKIDIGWRDGDTSWRQVGKRSLEWLQEVSFSDVEYVGEERAELRLRNRGRRQVLLLLHPRSFSNPGDPSSK